MAIRQGKIKTVRRNAMIDPAAPKVPKAAIWARLELEKEASPAAVVMLVKKMARPVWPRA